MFKLLMHNLFSKLANWFEKLANHFLEPTNDSLTTNEIQEYQDYYMNWKECGEVHPNYPDIKCTVLIQTTRDGAVIPHFNHASPVGPVGRMRMIEWIAMKEN